MNLRSLKFRLSLWHASWLTVALIAVALFIYTGLQHYLERELKTLLARRAQRASSIILRSAGDWGLVVRDIHEFFSPEANNRYIQISSGTNILYESGPPTEEGFDPAQVSASRSQGARRALPDGNIVFVASVQTNIAGTPILIEFGASTEQIQTTVREWVTVALIGLGLMLPIALAGGYLLVRRALHPVDQMIATASRISARATEERLPIPKTGDEIQRLAESLNAIIDRLDQALQHSQRFQADASHELRTPLMIVQADLEALREKVEDQEVRSLAGSALEAIGRLKAIIDDLFALTRLDAGEAQEWAPVDLAALLVTTVEQMSLLAQDKGISISLRAPAPVVVRGDRSRLQQIIVNLLDNSLKYTAVAGRITAEVSLQGRHAVLEISDTGIGISPQAISHIFERFYRADSARSREHGGGGLGLAIVEAMAKAHGGTVEARSEEGVGSRFIVRIPLDKEEAGQ